MAKYKMPPRPAAFTPKEIYEETGIDVSLGGLENSPQVTGAGTALIKPPNAEPSQQELIANPEIANQFRGTQIAPGTQESLFPSIGGTPLYSETFNPKEAAIQQYMLSPEGQEYIANATPEQVDMFARELASIVYKPTIEDAQDEEQFKKIWTEQNGNPFDINPTKQGTEVHKQSERDDWDDLFQGNKPFKGYMTEKENKDWLNFREKKLVDRKNDAIRDRNNQIQAFEFGIDQFKTRRAEQKALRNIQLQESKEKRLIQRSEEDLQIRKSNLDIAKKRENRLATRKPPTTAQALKRISNIRKSIATLNKTEKVDALMVKMMPEYASMQGTKVDPEEKKQMLDAFNEEISYLGQFTPKNTSLRQRAINLLRERGYPETEENIKGIMEQL